MRRKTGFSAKVKGAPMVYAVRRVQVLAYMQRPTCLAGIPFGSSTLARKGVAKTHPVPLYQGLCGPSLALVDDITNKEVIGSVSPAGGGGARVSDGSPPELILSLDRGFPRFWVSVTWTPKLYEIIACWTIFIGFWQSFYILLGSR